MWIRFVAALTLTVVSVGCSASNPVAGIEGADDAAKINVLFVGNSLTYTNDLPGILEALIESGGHGPAHIEAAAFANFGLEDHWAGTTAKSAIRAGGWDVVVLQQGPSATEGQPSLLEFSALFDGEIRAVGATTALYMVWPAQERFRDFAGVSWSYTNAAQQVDGLLYPVGEAWLKAWHHDADLKLYGLDGFHPSSAGTYLAALVMYEQLTGHSPVGLPADIRSASGTRLRITTEDAAVLQAAAVEANAEFARKR